MANLTEQITNIALELLEKHPEGIRSTELKKMIEETNSTFHPKTVNGIVWKLPEKFPDKVFKPERGLYKLLDYK